MAVGVDLKKFQKIFQENFTGSAPKWLSDIKNHQKTYLRPEKGPSNCQKISPAPQKFPKKSQVKNGCWKNEV